ncbi:hypothetical protein SESBI_23346 [Sesbania bispinosa]|nr:hypothetical protein SESBI_23346 [Sesbania bispinosa]
MSIAVSHNNSIKPLISEEKIDFPFFHFASFFSHMLCRGKPHGGRCCPKPETSSGGDGVVVTSTKEVNGAEEGGRRWM